MIKVRAKSLSYEHQVLIYSGRVLLDGMIDFTCHRDATVSQILQKRVALPFQ